MKSHINDKTFILVLRLFTKLYASLKFKNVVKFAHKPYFLMPGHIYVRTYVYTYVCI